MWRSEGQEWIRSQPPVGRVADLRAIADEDVWAVGKQGAAHFDGTRWQRESGVFGRLSQVRASTARDVWMAGDTGVWLGQPRDSDAAPKIEQVKERAGAVIDELTDLPFSETEGSTSVRVVEHELPRASGPRLSGARASAQKRKGARGVFADQKGGFWLWDDDGLLRWRGDRLLQVESERLHPVSRCGRCLASVPGGGVYDLRRGLLRKLSATGRESTPSSQIPDPVAVATGAQGDTWVVGASWDDALPRILHGDGSDFRAVTGPAPVTYSDVSVADDGGVWMVGGLSGVREGGRMWPTSTGVIARYDAASDEFVTHRIPYGALLAVAAVSDTEAWAVGYDGLIVHLREEKTRAWRLSHDASDGAQPPWLHAVLARGENDVWLAGESGIVLHFDGQSFERVVLSKDATVTGLAVQEGLWAIGPSLVAQILVRP